MQILIKHEANRWIIHLSDLRGFFCVICTDIFSLKVNTYMGTTLLLLTFDAR